jgi:hypothetical protein
MNQEVMKKTLLALAFITLTLLEPIAAIGLLLIFELSELSKAYLTKQKLDFDNDQLKRLEVIENEVKQLTQIQNLKNNRL